MKILSAITENLYLTIGLFCVVMLLSELTFCKRQMHYNFNDTERMKAHLLNTKFRLNEREGVDLAKINLTITRWHCIVLVASGLLMMLNVVAGGALYIVGSLVVTYFIILHIGKQYEKNPLKTPEK
mgnify:FL=1